MRESYGHQRTREISGRVWKASICFLIYLIVANQNPDVTPTQETAYLTETTFNLCQKHRSLVPSLSKENDNISPVDP